MFTKDIDLQESEIKFKGDKSTVFEGYASVFNGVDSYGDTILPGAYKQTIAERRRAPLMLFGHSPGRIIGKWMRLEEDSKGLLVSGELTPGHTDAQNVAASLRHGALSGLSIGFRIPKGGAVHVDPEDVKDGEAIRLIKAIDLIEVSVVSMPADDEARVDVESVKAHINAIETISEFEDFLREAGNFSRSSAKHLVKQFKAISQREAGHANVQDVTKAISGLGLTMSQITKLPLLRK